jgi:hypothetical protein
MNWFLFLYVISQSRIIIIRVGQLQSLTESSLENNKTRRDQTITGPPWQILIFIPERASHVYVPIKHWAIYIISSPWGNN